jgi:hypothetical protein
MADEKGAEEYGWRGVVKDIALVAGAIATCGGAAVALYYVGTFLAPYLWLLWVILLALAIMVGMAVSGISTEPFRAQLERCFYVWWGILPISAAMALLVHMPEVYNDKGQIARIGLFILTSTGILLQVLRRHAETNLRLGILERALQTGNTDIEATTREYIDDTINRRSTVGRMLFRSMGPRAFRDYIK